MNTHCTVKIVHESSASIEIGLKTRTAGFSLKRDRGGDRFCLRVLLISSCTSPRGYSNYPAVQRVKFSGCCDRLLGLCVVLVPLGIAAATTKNNMPAGEFLSSGVG